MTVLAVCTDHTNVFWAIPGVLPGTQPDFYSTTSGTDFYNKTVARNAVVVRTGVTEPIMDLGAEYSEFWLHFELDYSNMSVTANAPIIDTYDASGNLQIGVVETGTSWVADVRKSTNGTTYGTTLSGGTFTISTVTRVTWDIHYKIHASAGEVHVYLDGVLVYTFIGDTSTNGSNAIRYVKFTGGRSIVKYLSQGVAATEQTVGWVVSNLAPATGTQDFSAWTGDYSVIDEHNHTGVDSAYANTSDATSSYVIDDLDVSLSGMVVKAVVACARCLPTTGATTPNIDVGLSISSTFYTGGTSTLSATGGEVPVQNVFDTNPATASAFTQTEVNNLQLALRAKT